MYCFRPYCLINVWALTITQAFLFLPFLTYFLLFSTFFEGTMCYKCTCYLGMLNSTKLKHPILKHPQRRLMVFENRVLRRIFGPKRDDVTKEWRKLHNKELNDLYSAPNIVRAIKSRRMRLAGHVARMGERRGIYRVLVRKPEGRRPLGRLRHRWENNIKMDL